MSGYNAKIEIYKQIADFVSPLAESPNIVANCKKGDMLVIVDEEVWITNISISLSCATNFSKPVYSAEFVRINKKLFKKINK